MQLNDIHRSNKKTQHKKKKNATLSIKVLKAECRIFIILSVVVLSVVRLIVVAPFLGLKISFARC